MSDETPKLHPAIMHLNMTGELTPERVDALNHLAEAALATMDRAVVDQNGDLQLALRVCENCGGALDGRKSKRYCDAQCRDKHYYRRNQAAIMEKRRDDRPTDPAPGRGEDSDHHPGRRSDDRRRHRERANDPAPDRAGAAGVSDETPKLHPAIMHLNMTGELTPERVDALNHLAEAALATMDRAVVDQNGDLQLALRVCENCGGALDGRKSKRYCDAQCRDKHYYRRNQAAIMEKRRTRYQSDPDYREAIRIHKDATEAHPDQQPCEICGDPNTERHHDDYSKPLEIRWLCKPHHVKLHAEQRRGTNETQPVPNSAPGRHTPGIPPGQGG